MKVSRRDFLCTASVGALSVSGNSAFVRADVPAVSSAFLHEPARDTPVVEHADVLIAGGGPAGIAAALAAARAGASTRLIEVNGCLGGVWTAGLLSWILDATNKSGIMAELLRVLKDRGALRNYFSSYGYDPEDMKLVLENLCLEAGVKIQLHTRVAAAVKSGEKRLSHVITESKSGRQAWSADVFVDATGDGDVAAHAGCTFDYGRPGTGTAQPMSMICMVTGLDPEKVAPFVRGLAEPRGGKHPKKRLREEMLAAGVEPSYASPTLFCIRDALFCLMANHEYGRAGMSASDVTEATLSARAEVNRLVSALRKRGGVWKEMRIVATAEHIGVREGRRVKGLYEVTADDLIKGARHEDAVCRVTFPVDVHSTDPKKNRSIMREGVRAKPYDIPYRSLIARDVRGLLLAGRCISGDFIAHSSYRVTGNSVALGEAAGAAAFLASKTKRLPDELSRPEIKQLISKIKRP